MIKEERENKRKIRNIEILKNWKKKRNPHDKSQAYGHLKISTELSFLKGKIIKIDCS